MAVKKECQLEQGLPGVQDIKTAIEDGWLKCEKIKNHEVVQTLCEEIDLGESESIALFLEKKASLLLIDERMAREKAKNLGIKRTGILGILLEAKCPYLRPFLTSENPGEETTKLNKIIRNKIFKNCSTLTYGNRGEG